MVDTIEDVEKPYRSGDSNRADRSLRFTSEDELLNDICQMLHDMISVPSVISDHAKMIIARVRKNNVNSEN